MSSNLVRYGAVTFGNLTTINFHLDAYVNKTGFMRAVDKMEWRNQETNMSSMSLTFSGSITCTFMSACPCVKM